MSKPAILVIEDNDTIRLGLSETLQASGYEVRAYRDPLQALQNFRQNPVELVITDLKMEPIDGLEVLRRLQAEETPCEALMISAYGSVETAVQAMKSGAADFLTKPFSPDELRLRVSRIFEKIEQQKKLHLLAEQARYLKEEINESFPEIIGQSGSILSVLKSVRQVAVEDTSVLLSGESGTGKELVARAIHRSSRRAEKPFIRVNCGALNENLLESELFGHEKGAFTGAIRQKQGRFELADGGTIFLDEVGEISPVMQVKLLRILQEGEFERVGGEETLMSNTRVIAATNRNLIEEIKTGRFRDDLYYRLSVFPIHLPALRERPGDIQELTSFFLKKINNRRSTAIRFSEQALHLLSGYSWPGNIRELENMVERLCLISDQAEITESLVRSTLGLNGLVPQGLTSLDAELYRYEKQILRETMKACSGVKNQAAKKLGIKVSTLYYKLEKFGLLE